MYINSFCNLTTDSVIKQNNSMYNAVAESCSAIDYIYKYSNTTVLNKKGVNLK